MGYQADAVPDDLPPHPSQDGPLTGSTDIEQLVSGNGVDSTTVMRWSEYVQAYANSVTPPPGLPERFEDADIATVQLSDCSLEELVALAGWYIWHESDARDLFFESGPTDDRYESVEAVKKSHPIVHRFELDIDRVHPQALAISMFTQDSGELRSRSFDTIEGADGGAVVYYPPPVDDAAVVLFHDGRGYYCCHTEAAVEATDDWFRAEFEAWREAGIVPLQFDDSE
ncbi:hypothetical protein [Halolamina sediminis]|uniref:hypothetical protein n=1 Tax=Halolamina sediminis TaxID=1480675 RepID=UPI0006B481AC|nr:hypothetical protein [Halolamina sediminis]